MINLLNKMKHLVKKHRKKIVIGGFPVIAIIIIAINLAVRQPEALILLENENNNRACLGCESEVTVKIESNSPINAAEATIKYDASKLKFVSANTEKSVFDLWVKHSEEREENGEIRFGGGTTRQGGFLGDGIVMILRFKTTAPGIAEITLENPQVLAHDGKGTNIFKDGKNTAIFVQESTAENNRPKDNSIIQTDISPSNEEINPDVSGDGKVNFIDSYLISISIFKDYDPKYDINKDGKVNILDLAVFFRK
jgi:hypothetical protein